MTTHLEHSTSKLSNFITTLSRFPTNKVELSLLSIIHSAIDGVIIVDSSRQIVLVNNKAERMFGYPAALLLDKPLDILMPPRIDSDQRRRMDRLATTRCNSRRTKVELKGIRSNGEQLSLNASISRVTIHGELFFTLILHDAVAHYSSYAGTQRPVRPSELRKWAVSSQHANEVEKRRFSKKLYDDIGQRLSVLKP